MSFFHGTRDCFAWVKTKFDSTAWLNYGQFLVLYYMFEIFTGMALVCFVMINNCHYCIGMFLALIIVVIQYVGSGLMRGGRLHMPFVIPFISYPPMYK